MSPPQTSYKPIRRRPAHETLEKMLTAAEQQLREEELDAFTIQNVLQRSGLSVGAFYSRFPDKTALLYEIQKRAHDRVDTKILADLAEHVGRTRSLEDAVSIGFGALIRQVLAEREIFRALMMITVFEPVLRERAEQFNQDRKQALHELLAPHLDDIHHPDPSGAIDSAYAIYSSTMRGRLTYYGAPTDAQFGVTEDVLFDDLEKSMASFLRGPVRPVARSRKPAEVREDGE